MDKQSNYIDNVPMLEPGYFKAKVLILPEPRSTDMPWLYNDDQIEKERATIV